MTLVSLEHIPAYITSSVSSFTLLLIPSLVSVKDFQMHARYPSSAQCVSCIITFVCAKTLLVWTEQVARLLWLKMSVFNQQARWPSLRRQLKVLPIRWSERAWVQIPLSSLSLLLLLSLSQIQKNSWQNGVKINFLTFWT